MCLLFSLGVGTVATSGESPLCRCRYLQNDGTTPVFLASERGHDAVVAALLASGAAVNQARTVCVGVLSLAGGFAVCNVDLRCRGVSCLWLEDVRVSWYVVD